jgi:hypothetical protein
VLPPGDGAIVPEWQGYSYLEYGDDMDPATFAVVATLPL